MLFMIVNQEPKLWDERTPIPSFKNFLTRGSATYMGLWGDGGTAGAQQGFSSG